MGVNRKHLSFGIWIALIFGAMLLAAAPVYSVIRTIKHFTADPVPALRNIEEIPLEVKSLATCLSQKAASPQFPKDVGTFVRSISAENLLIALHRGFRIPPSKISLLLRDYETQEVCYAVLAFLRLYFEQRAISFTDFVERYPFGFDPNTIEGEWLTVLEEGKRPALKSLQQPALKPIPSTTQKKSPSPQTPPPEGTNGSLSPENDIPYYNTPPGGDPLYPLPGENFGDIPARPHSEDSVIDNDVRVNTPDPYNVYDPERLEEGREDILVDDFE